MPLDGGDRRTALKEEAKKLENQAAELGEQILAIWAISRDGVIAQLAILRQDLDDDEKSFVDVIAEGFDALAAPADDSKALAVPAPHRGSR